MTASSLDRIVTFSRATLVDDGFSTVTVWAPFGELHWALRQDVKDSEKWAAGQVSATISTRFHIRSTEFTRLIDARDRIICEGQTFEIVNVKEAQKYGRRQLIEFSAVAND